MATTFQGGPAKVPAQRAGTTASRPGHGTPAMLQVMQRSAGNAAVASYVQRLAESPGPARPTGQAPSSDPRFLAVTAKVASQGKALRQHPSPRAEAEKAKNAAVPPAGDKEAQAKEAQAATMAGAKPIGFDKAGFVAAVKAAIAAQAPKTLEEAEDFGKSGKAETVKNQVAGKVTDGKAASSKEITEKTAASPDQSKAVEKPVTPLGPEPQPAPARLDAAAAMPAPAPAEQTDLSGGKRDTEAAMAQADVSEQQLAGSNEPAFVGAVAAKKAGEQHSASAPAAFREKEAAQLGSAKQSAQGAGAAGLAGMLSAKKGALGNTAAGKAAAKSTDEAERAKVAGEVKAIFDATKNDVTAILGSLDGAVSTQFSDGEKIVREAFTADVKKRMADYKNRRYSGWDGELLWAKDKIFNLPKEADQEYVAARLTYENGMAALIGRIADTIGAKLTEAKDRIAKGRAAIKAYVDSRPKNLQKVAQAAASQFAEQFDQLESDVDSKKDALVEDLAAKYVESRAAVDTEITAMQDENKGLWDQAKDAVGGAIKTVLQLKDMLLTVLARAANAVDKIIKDPIAFLGNFVNAVKGGIVQFGQNIVEHLKKGLQGWLLGALAEGGIELPEKFDLKGIVQLLMSIFGMTWANVRARIVAKIGEPVMGKLEKGFEVIRILVTEGIGGLWKWVLEKVGNIKEMIMGKIKEMVSIEIVKAGIVWLISLLNPASAFVKACKMIYDVVMFFVEKADQIKEFVDSILDSVESIAAGGVGAVAGYIEKTLAKMLPVIIGFLASLLGLGGISGKIQKILETVQKPVNAVVDWVVGKAVKFGKGLLKKVANSKLGKKVRAGVAKAKAKVKQAKEYGKKKLQQGKAWVKGKIEAGKKWVKGKVEAGKKWFKGKVEKGKKLADDAGAKAGDFVEKMKKKLLAIVFKKNFTAAGEKHRVFTEKGRPEQLWVASERKLVSELTKPEIKERIIRYGNLVKSFQARIASLPATASKPVVDQLAKDMPIQARIIIADIVWLVAKEFNQEKAPAQLGNVALHSSQPDPRPGKGRLRRTWSEHVIPRELVTKFFMMLGKKGVTNSEYKKMTTVLTYKTASRIKDHGAGDLQMLALLRNNLPKGGRGIKNTPEQITDIKQSWNILSSNSIGREVAAVAGDYHMFKDVRKVDDKDEPMAPDQDRIQAAAASQKAEILALASKRGII